MRLTYSQRVPHCNNLLAKNLFTLMENKKTNLALSADVNTSHELLSLANSIGPEICVLKTHIDIINDFTPQLTHELTALAKQHHFFIFEDRKFADIGNTVKSQYANGIYRIADWADIVNAHVLPGPGIIQGLSEIGLKQQRGLLLLAEMSSANNLLTKDYAEKTLVMAKQFPEFVMGFISQHKLTDGPQWIYMTPGVQLQIANDTLGQQNVTPETALITHETDIIIVGRGIIHAPNPVVAAKKYREAGWEAYLKRIN